MKVKVIDLINLYIGYNTAQQVNERLGTKFAYSLHKNMPKLQKEAEFWDSLTPEKRQEIKDMEVEINLVGLHMSDLPEFFPVYQGRSAFQVFAPVLIDLNEEAPADEPSLLSGLLKAETEAQTEQEPVAMQAVAVEDEPDMPEPSL